MQFNPHLAIAGFVAALACGAAQAHVTLPPGGATAGSVYTANFRFGHPCKDASTTTALKIQLPAGFSLLDAQPRAGWAMTTGADAVSWVASSAQAVLRDKERATFTVRGRLPDKPGVLWFKVLQTCENGSAHWAEIPDSTSAKPAFPAARLDVLPQGVAAVDVQEAWARSTVAGQGAGGVFARLMAPSGARLVGGSTPVAEAVEVHEMRMDGNVMRMRALAQGLPLPAGETVELAPGGFHLMLMNLKQALQAGTTVPVTLRFVDPTGREATAQLDVPVRVAAPGKDAEAHRH